MALVNIKQMSEMMNVSPRWVQKLAAEGLPRAGRGKYDAVKVILWYVRYLQAALEKKAVPQGDGTFAGMKDERARSIRADAELKEMELAQKRRELVRVDDVARAAVDLVVLTKSRIMTVPARLAAEITGESSRIMVQARIEKALTDALSHLADDGSSLTLNRTK